MPRSKLEPDAFGGRSEEGSIRGREGHSRDKASRAFLSGKSKTDGYWRSYSPFSTRFKTVKPAFFASVIDNGFISEGVEKPEIIFRIGFLQAGQAVSGGADSGRRKVNRPPHAAQLPSHNSYS
jgi:hypothetical protein